MNDIVYPVKTGIFIHNPIKTSGWYIYRVSRKKKVGKVYPVFYGWVGKISVNLVLN